MTTLEAINPTSFIGATKTSRPLKIDKDHLQTFGYSTYLDESYVDLTISRNNAFGPDLVDGFLILSLLTYFSFDAPFIELEGAYALNYGLNRVRFTSPVMVGDEVFVSRTVTDVKAVAPSRARLEEKVEMKRAADGELVMIAEWISYIIDGAAENGE